jgi:hypothetical protein
MAASLQVFAIGLVLLQWVHKTAEAKLVAGFLTLALGPTTGELWDDKLRLIRQIHPYLLCIPILLARCLVLAIDVLSATAITLKPFRL